jgi:predicted PurR-regulated permease PerM
VEPIARRVPGPRWLKGPILGLLPFLVLAGLFFLMGWLLAGHIREEIRNWPATQEGVNALLARISEVAGISPPLTVRMLTADAAGYFGQSFTTAAGLVVDAVVAVLLIVFGTVFLLTAPEGQLVRRCCRWQESSMSKPGELLTADMPD